MISLAPLMRARTRGPDATATMAALQTRYLPVVFGYVFRRVASRDEADDATAETFAAAFASLSRCPPPDESGAFDPARAWLLGIARRKVADVNRRRVRRRETTLDDAAGLFPMVAGPEARSLDAEAAAVLRHLVDSLNPPQREVLLLKYVEELSLTDIGVVMGRSPAAVSSLLQRARAAAFAAGRDYPLAATTLPTRRPRHERRKVCDRLERTLCRAAAR